MDASRQVKIPFYRGIGWQSGRGFDALAEVIEGTGSPFLRFLRKYLVLAAERVDADW